MSLCDKCQTPASCGGDDRCLEAYIERRIGHLKAPIDMVLHCPKCHAQHIDAPEQVCTYPDCKCAIGFSGRLPVPEPVCPRWTNPPHRSHLCHNCDHIWRPADVPTNGVAAVKTRGKEDSPL